MHVRIDQVADAVYVNPTVRPIKDSAEIADGIVVDCDADVPAAAVRAARFAAFLTPAPARYFPAALRKAALMRSCQPGPSA